MKNKQRVQAFTLLELTIAMLIAAICMGIAFYVLSTFNRIGITQQRAKKEAYLRQLFAQRMQQEVLEAQQIWLLDNTIMMANQDKQTQYSIQDSAIIRFQAEVATDTLRGTLSEFTVRYVDQLPEELVSSLSFTVQTEDGQYPFVLRKLYSAEELVHLSLPTAQ